MLLLSLLANLVGFALVKKKCAVISGRIPLSIPMTMLLLLLLAILDRSNSIDLPEKWLAVRAAVPSHQNTLTMTYCYHSTIRVFTCPILVVFGCVRAYIICAGFCSPLLSTRVRRRRLTAQLREAFSSTIQVWFEPVGVRVYQCVLARHA